MSPETFMQLTRTLKIFTQLYVHFTQSLNAAKQLPSPVTVSKVRVKYIKHFLRTLYAQDISLMIRKKDKAWMQL